jgi:hypothetical protein
MIVGFGLVGGLGLRRRNRPSVALEAV